MLNQYFKKNPLFKIVNSTLVELPTPVNISYLWNFGSLLGICLIIQIVSGVLLASSYSPDIQKSFEMVIFMMNANDKGWFIRYIHANGASLFFVCLYMHIGRGIYYSSYLFIHTWNVGVLMFIMTMAAAFLGYVLPVNQMSFWGASVITNLFSEIPYIGPDIVKTIWGGVSVDNPTITRFFTFHFIIPFVILALMLVHITLLHQTGSNNPLGLTASMDKIPFHAYFSFKDLYGMMVMALVFMIICLLYPLSLGDDENFIQANPAMTPRHIQPEWYFLFAYAILRSIPNKLGGVIALLLSVVILYVLPFTHMGKMKSTSFYPVNKIMFWTFVTNILLLTWIGACPVEDPYVITGQILTVTFFLYFLVNPILSKMWDKMVSV